MSSTKRRLRDVFKLLGSGFECSTDDETAPKELLVKFQGPKDSPYEGGIWKVCVKLPADYPFKSPSIGFCNRIYHPNIDEMSGSVCLDVINQTWSSMFTLVAVFDQFLPQLLMYPNPSDPLNGQAAALLMKSKEAYEERVKEYVTLYAKNPFGNSTSIDNDAGDAQQEEVSDEDLEDAEDEDLSDADDDVAI